MHIRLRDTVAVVVSNKNNAQNLKIATGVNIANVPFVEGDRDSHGLKPNSLLFIIV